MTFTLMKLTAGVNFTIILQAAFRRANPKSAERKKVIVCLFALLGSARAKASGKTLLNLTQALGSLSQISRLICSFSYRDRFISLTN
jgi:hypothetical protein